MKIEAREKLKMSIIFIILWYFIDYESINKMERDLEIGEFSASDANTGTNVSSKNIDKINQ